MIEQSVDHKPGQSQLHHQVPRCLLRLRDKAEDHPELDGEGLQLWMEYELEAHAHGIDPDVGRDELARMIEESVVEVPADDHRNGHREARDFVRWENPLRGRRGGIAALSRYGAGWFRLLGLRRWNRIGPEALTNHVALSYVEASYMEAATSPERA